MVNGTHEKKLKSAQEYMEEEYKKQCDESGNLESGSPSKRTVLQPNAFGGIGSKGKGIKWEKINRIKLSPDYVLYPRAQKLDEIEEDLIHRLNNPPPKIDINVDEKKARVETDKEYSIRIERRRYHIKQLLNLVRYAKEN